MPDEVKAFSMLGSWLYGSLIHATGVLGRTFETDLTAARFYEVKDHTYSSFVDLSRLGWSHESERKAQAWAMQKGSLFDQIKKHHAEQVVFRPWDLLELDPAAKDGQVHSMTSQGGNENSLQNQQEMDSFTTEQLKQQAMPMFEGLGSQIQVTDCLCMGMKVHGNIWTAVALMRCDDSKPFDGEDQRTLKKIKPALAHMLRSDCARQGLTAALEAPVKSRTGSSASKRWSTDQIISKLTRTECQVLGYLRLAATEREISQEVHRSQHTVHVHVKNIYRKLDVNSRSELLELFGDTLRD